MKMNKRENILTLTILSVSLLTVMAGAAVAPALGAVKAYFSDANPLLVQLIVSMPSLFIILTNLCFPALCKVMRTRTMAVSGLALYVAAGCGVFFAKEIAVILVLRALLGVSVGVLMPLSTGLLAWYFPPERMAGLMGLSAAMNQMGGVIATLLAGLLATIAWNYAFLVYSLGLITMVLVLLFLPDERLNRHNEGSSAKSGKELLRFHPSVVGMLLLMTIFFVYPTNFALTARTRISNPMLITWLMVGMDFVAFLTGLFFGKMMPCIRHAAKYIAPAFFLAGYVLLSLTSSLAGWITASACIGIAVGFGVPYLMTIASIKGGKDSATTVMPLISAALYLGQFVSPLIVTPLARLTDAGVYLVAVGLSLIYLLQTFLTRRFHRLPPR